MTSLFFSYTHKDEALRDELETHLALMKRQKLIDGWHDRRILAGDEVDDSIKKELEDADIILLLVSSDFIASNYCYSKEMTRAMERHEAKEARVIPVILRSCDWHSAPFGKLLAAPKDGRAITTWPDRDVAFTDVAKQVRTAVESMSSAKSAAGSVPASAVRAAAPQKQVPAVKSSPSSDDTGFAGVKGAFRGNVMEEAATRSSNLRLKKTFTDLDKDNFVQECFDFMVKFFESSIDEVKQRNADVDGRVERIDSRRFVASLYRGGKTITQCSIQREAGFRGKETMIAFSFDASMRTGSYNEHLTVEATDQALFMKPLSFGGFSGQSENQQLSVEGSAELYWGMFIQRAQT